MTDTQRSFAIGLPCLTVMASLVLSMFTISGVRDDIRSLRAEMIAMRAELTSDIKNIVGKLGAMDVEIAKLMDKKG